MKVLIKLKDAHEKSGLSAYAVAKELNLNGNTVRKYVQQDNVMQYIPVHVIQLAKFYGVDWRDPEIVEVIEESGDDSPETKTLLAAMM